MLLSAAARVPFVIPIPTEFRVQSVAPLEVADRLIRCLGEGPGERLPDFGGPEVLTLCEAPAAPRAAAPDVQAALQRAVPALSVLVSPPDWLE